MEYFGIMNRSDYLVIIDELTQSQSKYQLKARPHKADPESKVEVFLKTSEDLSKLTRSYFRLLDDNQELYYWVEFAEDADLFEELADLPTGIFLTVGVVEAIVRADFLPEILSQTVQIKPVIISVRD
jgi:hypothetical protein